MDDTYEAEGGDSSEKYIKYSGNYYYLKAKVDILTDLVKEVR